MNQQKESKLVQYWANNHLVVFGNQYQLIDNETQKNIFQFTANSTAGALNKCYRFLRYGEKV